MTEITSDPLKLVMLGDLVDLAAFAEHQTKRFGFTVNRKDVQHLAHRRVGNGCPHPALRFASFDVYIESELQHWWDAYVLTHPSFLGGKARPALILILEEANE